MAFYMVVNYRISDPEQMQKYRELVVPQLRSAGCEFLVATDELEALEGTPQSSLIVAKFESRQAFTNWYNSSEYHAIKHLRIDATDDSWLAIADEFVMPSG